MKTNYMIGAALIMCALLITSPLAYAQSEKPKKEAAPPVEQALVREGNFALKLVDKLKLGPAANEVEAESKLGAARIAPRNGWIADYPVTPDIISETRKSIGDAADAKKLKLKKDEALKAFDELTVEVKLGIKPYAGGKAGEQAPNYENYANPNEVNNYYYESGPPIVTYYPPPPDYYYLYNWVPFPFWWFDFFFPGFFVLVDFHRVVVVSGSVVVISNHFTFIDPVTTTTKVFRIDPVHRFSGKTFAGIGVQSKRGMISTGIPHSDTRVFNSSRTMPSTRGREIMRPSRRRMIQPTPGGRGMMPTPAPGGGMRGR